MALIKCSECGKEISDKATACPHCGCPVQIQPPVSSTPEPVPTSPSSTVKHKKRGCGCGLYVLILFIIALVFSFAMAISSDDNQSQSELAEVMELNSEQEEAILEIFSSCGIGDITEVTLFKDGETSNSYYVEDEETAYYSGADNTIVVWVNDDTKEIEAIYYHDYDIYVDGTILGQVSDYYISEEQRDTYRNITQAAIKSILIQPDTAKFRGISAWAFGISDDGYHIAQSTVTYKNALGTSLTSNFQATFSDGNLISLIVDGTEYIQ